MHVRIAAIGSALPPCVYRQQDVLALMAGWIGGERRIDRVLARVYGASGIERRHSVLGDFLRGDAVHDPGTGDVRAAGTGERNARYAREAPALAQAAAEQALARLPDLERSAVTHLVTVSCTGFHTPGTDDHLVRCLGLRRDVERTHVGFMGCSAAFPALRLARAVCRADPDAVVLVAAVELCTLHLRPSRDMSSVLATSLFADGAAAAVVSARELTGTQTPLELVAFSTYLSDGGRDEMAWTIGDHGFEMLLSPDVPGTLAAELPAAVQPLLAAAGADARAVPHWAVHPGGRAILDRVERELGLPDAALAASRSVLARAGNMSSATVLFVLEELASPSGAGAVDASARARPAEPGEWVGSLAFGPGLTLDGALLRAG